MFLGDWNHGGNGTLFFAFLKICTIQYLCVPRTVNGTGTHRPNLSLRKMLNLEIFIKKSLKNKKITLQI